MQTNFKPNQIRAIVFFVLLLACLPNLVRAQKYYRLLTPEKHVVVTLQKSNVELFLLDTLIKEPVIGRIEQVNSEGISLKVNGFFKTFLWNDVKLIRVRRGTIFNLGLLATYWVGIGIAEVIYLQKLVSMENNKSLALYHGFLLGATVWIPPFFFKTAQQTSYPIVELSPKNGIWVSALDMGF